MKKIITALFLILIALFVFQSASAEPSIISEGKAYSLITSASDAYPDDTKKLTDGVYGTVPDGSSNYYSSNAYVGFNQSAVDENGDFVILLDLGEVRQDITAFSVGFLNETSVGIFAPKSITVAISDTRNQEFSDVGTLDTKKSVAANLSETHVATLSTDNLSGRYVRFTIKHLGEYIDDDGATKTAGWTFIDEIAVYSSGDSGDLGNTSDTSDESDSVPPQESEIDPQPPVVPGDKENLLSFILLAAAALCMTIALFAKNKQTEY